MFVAPADFRPFVVYGTSEVFGKVPAFILYIQVPVAVLNKDRYALMTQVPFYIIVIILVFGSV